jgi:hypothetical protein
MIKDKEAIIDRLTHWMKNVLEKPNKNLGGWSLCPFARKARINNQIYISFIDWINIDDEIDKSLLNLEKKDVCVLLFDPKELNNNKLFDYIYNKNKVLMEKDYLLIMDHPDEKEELNGISTHFQHAGIVLVFKLHKLNSATKYLEEKGYFKHWPKDRIEEGINWRLK